MTSPVVAPTDSRTTPLAARRERLALIRQGGPEQPLAELAEAPVTIGSGPRCTLRLTEADLRPLQCVITPTEEGPRVRSWAAGTLLNGDAFEEAPLTGGDLLQLGQIELLVVDLAAEEEAEVEVGEYEAPNEELDATAESEVLSVAVIPEVSPEPAAINDPGSDASFDLAELAGHEWAMPSDFQSDTLPLAEGIAESVQAWSDALPGEVTSKTTAALPETQAFQDELDGLRNQLVENYTTAQESNARVELLDERQKNNRRRVSRLVGALRSQFGEAELLRAALEEREQESLDQQTRLESALALGDAVRAEIAEMELRHAQEMQAQAERLEAEYAARLAETQPVMVSEQPEQPEHLDETVAAEETEPSWSMAEVAEPLPVEAEEAEASDTMWEEAAPEGAESLPAPEDDTPVVSEPIAAEDSPWGIEQLTSNDEVAAPFEQEAPVAEAEPEAPTLEEQAKETPPPISTDWFAADTPAAEEEVAEEAEPQPQPHVEPESFIEKYGHLIPDEEEAVEPVAEYEAVSEPEPVDEPNAAEDDSIDDYMHRLMQRVRGEEPSQEEIRGDEVKQAEPLPIAEAPGEPAPAAEPIQCLSELTRSAAPEANADMDALRQLANQSARSAIQVANNQQGRENATLHLMGSVIGLVFGAITSITAESPFGVPFIGGLIAVVGCGWYGVKTLGFFQAYSAAEELGEGP